MNIGFDKFVVTTVMFTVAAYILSAGCNRLNVEDTLKGEQYTLVDQRGDTLIFPDEYYGKVILAGYVYTHCPDICPVITYNMRDVQRGLEAEDGVTLLSISFDPERDTPEVLSDYAERYRIDQKNWRFLTGDVREVETLLNKLNVRVVKTPTSFTEQNEPIYFMDHTDKVTLIDRQGRIRQTYTGSELNREQVIEDIQSLLKES